MRKLMAVLAVVVLFGCGSSGSEDAAEADETTTSEKVTTTRERTTTTARPTTTTLPPYTPVPEDFELAVIETERECFGSAGCSVNFQVELTYNGEPLEPDVEYLVVYDVVGAEQAQTANLTVRGDQYAAEPVRARTAADTPITAVATNVLPA